jgi:hypothetical protein
MFVLCLFRLARVVGGMGAAQLTLLDVAPKQPADERSHAQSLMRRHQSQGQYLGPSGLGPATKTAKNE